MRDLHHFYIGGQWVAPAGQGRNEVINPASGTVAGSIAMGDETDVDRAVQAAADAFPAFAATAPAERLELLQSIIATYRKRYDDMAMAITEEMGAPYHTLSRPAQAAAGLAHFQSTAALLGSFPFDKAQGGSRILREPIGVCALITPWNWPANQITCKVAPALAAGCTIVLKPSQLAPFSAQVLTEILQEAGVPPGVFNMINGAGSRIGMALAAHPQVDLVSLTGSNTAGIAVAKAAAETIKRVSLELGGKSANLLLDDADFPKAVTHGVLAMMSNSGQSCNAPSRMLVPAARLAEVEQIAAAALARLVIGDPMAPDTTFGPVANRAQFDKVQEMIATGIEEGATLIAGGLGKPDPAAAGHFARPTIFSRVRNSMTIAREEIFGPVLCILPYEDEADAVRIANDSPYGLSGYVSAGTIDRARAVARRLRTGNVHLNGAGPDFMAPFGGYKQSGNGREWGAWGIEEFLETKAVLGYEPTA